MSLPDSIQAARAAATYALRLIEEIRAELRPGECPWCEGPIGKKKPGQGRKLKRCRKAECERAYYIAYAAGRRQGQKLAKAGRK